MKQKYLLLSIFMIAAIALFTTSSVSSKKIKPPAGNSGDPFTHQSCGRSGCHPTAHLANGSILSLTIGTGSPTTALNSSFKYAANTTYNIAFSLTSSTGSYGFQMVALDAANTQAGTFVNTGSTDTVTTSAATGTRQYIGHKNANSIKNWVFKWTSPSASTGDVTFYYAYNQANGDNSANGDIIDTGKVTISALSTGLNDMSDKISELNIFPNPISNDFSMSFNLMQEGDVSVRLFSVDGKLMKELINQKMAEGNFYQQFDISEFPAGIYLVQLNVGESSITRKIIKQ